MFPPGKIRCSLIEGNKSRPVFMQVTSDGGNCYFGIYDTDIAKKPRISMLIQQSIAKWYSYDIMGKSVTLIGPTEEAIITFANQDEAEHYFKLFNSKSDIFKDQQLLKKIDDDLSKIWPFPQIDT